ncbi:SLAC1 anion channel family protein [Variovorax sp. OV329]|uniref:SLAC1 anion channel family protein n=1 Tax=Variovorax sp. OV329 TaxID=1882825 RepID=UPI0008E59FDF|nr:SLAC1 anion channel family protein [Variovorax sp. OV329]SFN21080.1 tellurite resistance protein [Variovorax sp. OV329]
MEAHTKEAVASKVPSPDSALAHLPVGLFGSATGIGGLGAAWHLAHHDFGLPGWPSALLATISLLVFAAMSAAYLVKLLTAPEAVRAEFAHSVSGSLFGLIPIALMLLPIPLVPLAPRLAMTLWAVGAVSCLGFTAFTLYRWMSARQQAELALPAWIIPVGGPLNLPIAMPALGLDPLQELAMFAFAIGIFFSVLVFALVFSRLLFQLPPPQQALPALLILTAPFSIGSSAYLVVTGHGDLFSQSLFMVDLLLLCVLAPLLTHLPRCCPFRVSWWAVSFPLAAATVASLHFAALRPNRVNEGIALMLLGVTTLVVLWLMLRTMLGLLRGELRLLVGA